MKKIIFGLDFRIKDLRSPVVFSVHCILSPSGVPYSGYCDTLDMGVSFDYQVGGNDCVYWTGNHHAFLLQSAGWRTEHTEIGINTYGTPGFEWFNWGSGYDDYEVEVVRESNGDGFTNRGSEDATITFSGGDDWALVEPSDDEVLDWSPLPGAPDTFDSTTYYVPVTYSEYIQLDGRR